MKAACSLLIASCVLIACGDSERSVSLLLDLRTDLVGGAEFVRVQTERFGGVPRPLEAAPPEAQRVTPVPANVNAVDGLRIASFEGLSPGNHVVRIRLLGAADQLILERIAVFSLKRSSVFSVVMTRDCRGVICPGPGNDPALIACLGGRCVRPECTPETPEFCPESSCVEGSTCIAVAACAVPICTSGGTCLRGSLLGACPPGQYCNPDVGCLETGVPIADGGSSDAGMNDAGGPPLDGSSLDASPADASSADAAMADASVADAADPDALSGDAGIPMSPLVLERLFGTFGNSTSITLTDVEVDGSGNLYFSGYFVSLVDFGGGALRADQTPDVFLVSYDASGNHRWSVSYGGIDATMVEPNIAVDSGGHVVIGGTFSNSIDVGGQTLTAANLLDMYVARIDSQTGANLWVQTFDGGSFDFVFGIDADANGNMYVGGSFSGTIDFGGVALTSRSSDGYVVSFRASDGRHRWSKSFGGPGNDHVREVSATTGGALYAAGEFEDTADFQGSMRTSAGSIDGFVLRQSTANGSMQWVQPFGGTGRESITAVAADSTANVYIGGNFRDTTDLGAGPVVSAGETDLLLVSFDGAGGPRWSRTAGSMTFDNFSALAVDPSDRVVLVGRAGGPLDLGGGTLETPATFSDMWIASFESGGAHRWSHLIGGASDDGATALTFDAAGLLYLGGNFGGTVDFGDGSPSGSGGSQIFVAKYSEAP